LAVEQQPAATADPESLKYGSRPAAIVKLDSRSIGQACDVGGVVCGIAVQKTGIPSTKDMDIDSRNFERASHGQLIGNRHRIATGGCVAGVKDSGVFLWDFDKLVTKGP